MPPEKPKRRVEDDEYVSEKVPYLCPVAGRATAHGSEVSSCVPPALGPRQVKKNRPAFQLDGSFPLEALDAVKMVSHEVPRGEQQAANLIGFQYEAQRIQQTLHTPWPSV